MAKNVKFEVAFYTFVFMAFTFYKYQGTGNDFILIDNRHYNFPKNNTKLIAGLCDRKFGIGADGLILLENHDTLNFQMVYFNSDGAPGSFCGNGSRCLTHFANYLGIIDASAVFEAADGLHSSSIEGSMISVAMKDVGPIKQKEGYLFLDTGSPHHVEMVSDLANFDVVSKGRNIRNTFYSEAGANVNFVEQIGENTFAVRTYERGVEDETLSCGTGVTAVAIAMAEIGLLKSQKAIIETQGGILNVIFSKADALYTDVHLIGPAVQVFNGTIE